jgi:hypothetical protein
MSYMVFFEGIYIHTYIHTYIQIPRVLAITTQKFVDFSKWEDLGMIHGVFFFGARDIPPTQKFLIVSSILDGRSPERRGEGRAREVVFSAVSLYISSDYILGLNCKIIALFQLRVSVGLRYINDATFRRDVIHSLTQAQAGILTRFKEHYLVCSPIVVSQRHLRFYISILLE